MRRTTGTRAVRRTAAATIAVLALGGLAACNSDDKTTATDPSASDSSTGAALASSLSEGDTVDPAEFVQTVEDGVKASTTAHMTMDISAGAAGKITAEGDVDYTSTPPSMAMTMTLPAAAAAAGDMDIRMVDGVMYLSIGQLTQGKFWKIDPSDPNGPLAAMGMDKMMDQMDPGKALELMKGGISKVTYVGAEDGLDHYALTIDMKKMMASMGADLPEAAQSQLPDSVTYDLWLDDQNRFTKMSMDNLPMGGSDASMEMTVSDWGKAVDIQAPPADQVIKMPDLGSMMQGLTSGSGNA
ncbi:LppX_LprAFG lipoprotein [Nocardioides sp. URHA0032]|uniref:LppX_LprAFG lipoprotein n=1 Tax=Nocardioides sp. URHA0032 TaxID=1380388 RepID=UPI0004903E41|nr:LppX_LprAFG lipoprotein [Nocardioides sp. URHA0032]